ncbi:MAG: hypothetical protein LBH01_02075 [Verrucomicrobiales bacterium]|jgi:hypothetical protein|nr:hypothetical protein [Verrucomicrobiales bacterium]
MSDFAEGMDAAFDAAIGGDMDARTVTVGGMEIPAILDNLIRGASRQPGGTLQEYDVEIFVRREDWRKVNGRRGVEVGLPNGETVRVKKLGDYGGSRISLVCSYTAATSPQGS